MDNSKKKKDLLEGMVETGPFFEEVAKEAGFQGYGRGMEIKKPSKSLKVLKGKLGGTKKIWEKTSPHFLNLPSVMIKLFIAFLISFYAFYPETIQSLFWPLIIGIIVIVVVLILIAVFASSAMVLTMRFITPLLISFIILAIVVGMIQFISSPNYSRLLEVRYGTLIANLAFLGSLILAIALIVPGGMFRLIGGSIVCGILFFFAGPFLLSFLRPEGFCIPVESKTIPLPIPESLICHEEIENKTTLVFGGEMIEVPVRGGIRAQFGFDGTPRALPAGQSYQEAVFIFNRYEKPIKILDAAAGIVSSNHYINFIIPNFKLNKTDLEPGERHGEILYFDKDKLEAKPLDPCDWSQAIIDANEKYATEKSECAWDNNTCGEKGACVTVANFVCKCTDWRNETCSGKPLYMILNVTHTGFFKGNVSLYYFNSYSGRSITFPKLTQGPVSIKADFIPNPYIAKWYEEFVKNVSLFVDFTTSRPIHIDSDINVTPITTTVSTLDYTHGLIFNETVGINKIKCNFSDLVNVINEGKKEYMGEICYFTPPFVNLTITKMKSGETLVISNVTLDRIEEYCSLNRTTIEEYCANKKGGELVGIWAKDWCDVYRYIDKSGLCSVLGSQKVGRALKYTQVIIEFNYTTTDKFSSPWIQPYYTPACD